MNLSRKQQEIKLLQQTIQEQEIKLQNIQEKLKQNEIFHGQDTQIINLLKNNNNILDLALKQKIKELQEQQDQNNNMYCYLQQQQQQNQLQLLEIQKQQKQIQDEKQQQEYEKTELNLQYHKLKAILKHVVYCIGDDIENMFRGIDKDDIKLFINENDLDVLIARFN